MRKKNKWLKLKFIISGLFDFYKIQLLKTEIPFIQRAGRQRQVGGRRIYKFKLPLCRRVKRY